MIIVKLIGGLGNQMFQYAFGRRTALNHKTLLKLDILGYKDYKLHKYSLNCFKIIENFALEKEVSRINKLFSKLSYSF